MPFLKKISFDWEPVRNNHVYPFNIPAIAKLEAIELTKKITFFVGENGSGKSTLLEALAMKCGFSLAGGSRNALIDSDEEDTTLASIVRLAWLPKITNGFFLRAETFYNYANYIDELAKDWGESAYQPYGGKSLHQQSHGEAFLSLFLNRYGQSGIYILDEPEAALSPMWQMTLMLEIKRLVEEEHSQFLIATHSPILITYPDADIFEITPEAIMKTTYDKTESYQITKRFLDDPKLMLDALFED